MKTLDAKVGGLDLQAPQIANGAVGLLDEVSSSKITGEEDRYSHTDMSDFQGNFDGAKEAFDAQLALDERGEGTRVTSSTAGSPTLAGRACDRYKRDTPGYVLYDRAHAAGPRQLAQQVDGAGRAAVARRREGAAKKA